MNLVEADVAGDRVRFAGYDLPAGPTDLRAFEGRRVILGIRPSDLEDHAVWQAEGLPTIEVATEVTEELGSEVNVLSRVDAPPVDTEEVRAASEEADEVLLVADEPRCTFCARVDARTACKPGSTITLSVDPSRFHFFDPETGRAIDPVAVSAG